MGTPDLQAARGLGAVWTPTGDLHFSRGRPSPGTVLSGRERLEGTVQAALPGRGAGKENFLRRLGGEGERGKGGGGARIVCRSVTQRDSLGLRPPREGGHPSTRVQGSERRAVPGASAPGRNRGVLQGREGAPAPAPPRHTSWVTVVGQEGYRKR